VHVAANDPYHCEFNVALVSPPRAPTVTNDPVALWHIHAHDVDGMVDIVVSGTTSEDAALVLSPVAGIDSN
jgi:hypothetical protein